MLIVEMLGKCRLICEAETVHEAEERRPDYDAGPTQENAARRR
jgi:hypothetical protein